MLVNYSETLPSSEDGRIRTMANVTGSTHTEKVLFSKRLNVTGLTVAGLRSTSRPDTLQMPDSGIWGNPSGFSGRGRAGAECGCTV